MGYVGWKPDPENPTVPPCSVCGGTKFDVSEGESKVVDEHVVECRARRFCHGCNTNQTIRWKRARKPYDND